MTPSNYFKVLLATQSVALIHIVLIGQFDLFTPLRSLLGFFIGALTLGMLLMLFVTGIRLYLINRTEESPQRGLMERINLIAGVFINPIFIYLLMVGVMNHMGTLIRWLFT